MPSSELFQPSGLNKWAANDRPVRMDFVRDNEIMNGMFTNAQNAVPSSRMINNKRLEADIELLPEDVGADPSRLTFTMAIAMQNSWAPDTTYTDYGFRSAITLAGVKQGMIPNVIFAPAEATSGIFAPVADSYDGGIYIYAQRIPDAAVIIPTIIIWR